MKILFICICLPVAAFCLEFNFTYSRYSTEHFWNKNGKERSTHNHFEQQQYELFGRYYPTGNDCVEADASYVQVEDRLNKNARGLSDPKLTWTHCFYRGNRQTLSTQLIGIFPGGGTKENLRYGKFAGEAGLLYSTFYRDIFLDASLGYRIYQGFPSDQVRGYFALGTFLHPRFYVEASLQLDWGVYNGKSQINQPIILWNANYRLLKAEVRGIYHLYRMLYVAGGWFQHVWGRNVGTNGGWKAEMWMVF